MVSYDHFRIAVVLRLRKDEALGASEINSVEFCNSLHKGTLNVEDCCKAMKDEMKPGDVIEHERDSGIGLTIRYQLPLRA